jgi:hypothetical protein
MFTRHSLIVAAALCALVPALAQDRPQDKSDAAVQLTEMRATAAYPTRQDAGQWLGLNLIGAKVVSASNDTVGKIANLVLNENGAVDAAVIRVGGFMGFGGRDVAVTYDSLNIVRNRKGDGIDHVVIAATKDDLRQAARFKSLHRQMAETKPTTPLP